ncbi:MAG: hypothetical protein ABI585_11180 [Betaproteobacteria bacterium]
MPPPCTNGATLLAGRCGALKPQAEASAATTGFPVDAYLQSADRRFQGVCTLSPVIVSAAGCMLAYKLSFIAIVATLRLA